MENERKRRSVALKSDGTQVALVDEAKLRTLIFQWREGLLPIGNNENPIEYVRSQLGIPENLSFTGANLIQIAKSLETERKKRGEQLAQAMNRSGPPPEEEATTEVHINRPMRKESPPVQKPPTVSPPEPKKENSPFDKIRTVSPELARHIYLVAKMVNFLLMGDDLLWGFYVLEQAGFKREDIEKEYQEAVNRLSAGEKENVNH